MSLLKADLLLLQVLHQLIVFCLSMEEITFHLVEENKKDLIIGNLNYFIRNQMKTDPKEVEFHIGSKYFGIDNKLKNVFVKTVIDLDILCSADSQCCYKDVCIIDTKVVVQENKQYKTTFLMKVEVKDVDDNLAMFLEDRQLIKLSEKISINTSIPVDGAIDRDFSKAHQKKIYYFFDESSTFQLHISQHDSDLLSIIVMKQLDFESQSMFHCVLKACDRKSQNCITKSIIVQVIDENDNEPMFENKLYEVKIPENYPTGKKIIKVFAKDADGALYNKTLYGIHSENYLKSIFQINKYSGVLSLKKSISVNEKRRYSFTVFAIDALSVSFKKDFAVIKVDIEDVNDNHPIISLLHGPMPDLYTIQIDENNSPKSLFSVHISDKDLGINAVVNCSLYVMKDDLLEMVKVDIDIYQIRTITSFDYEIIQSVEAEIICIDSGRPSLTSKKVFSVNVADVNEYEPKIKNSLLEIHLKENIPANKFVVNIEVSDKDKGAFITYSLDKIGSLYFVINAHNGEIVTSSVPLDREQEDNVRFTVIVTDSVEKAHTATAVVTVFIVDQNDNGPQFVHTLPFIIPENQYIYTKLSTKVEATDADKEEINRSIVFRLLQTFNCRMEMIHEQMFDVNAKGEIETMATIDREKDNNFTLTILAQDKGNPPISNSTNITITIIDINDNSPVWIYPDSFLSTEPSATINVSKDISLGTVIGNLKAYDIDLDEAGKVNYFIISSDIYYRGGNFLLLNESSGSLTISQYPLTYGKNHLRVRAQDNGQPQLYKDANLIINVLAVNDNLFSGLNMAIIIGMLSITAVISIFLVIAIFFIRRSPNSSRTCRLSDQSISKDCQNNLKSSYKDLVEYNEKQESVFTDHDCHQVYFRNRNMDPGLSLYPQSTMEGACPTYVRFAPSGSYHPEIDGESADSGKGTSDLNVDLQTNMKASTNNLYGGIQLIPSSRVNYFVPNKSLRRSYQVINEGEQSYNTNTFHQNILSNSIHSPEPTNKLCSYQTFSFSS